MDLNYMLMRQQIERTRADRADCDRARAAHSAMADLYLDRIDFRRRALLTDSAVGPTLRPSAR